MSTLTKQNHIGRKISRIRELRDMKQEALAQALGTNQQAVSIIENSETIDEEKLVEVAKALGVTVEAIKNFSDEAAINYFNSFTDTKNSQVNFGNHCTFNPLDKLVEAFEENKKLYERLLESEKEKKSYLEKLLKDK
ncbi:helix-turn-helix domain-containing protein [Flavobacterium johnsoniae]|jgi:transcriptional regulator with XRE-family HTH domain|uniref:Transcriptional regulator, XRE family n=1 Tax=Flavobacterium johnsoniae (strain ATCC 17061 / DSM 2064 / JCM 8514 / BCRC 14874 / CCUG 350202 / NBRC 14942 / NCIMB 11054 / UW101) TaxID=376686 RepID=A5FI88_FLAJ1|nr:helix-turn-helix transcriptional regulator [Flavobacterium johnsoniae]ABQ05079.1 transcriptional regulator, XRE family [Flavobacterium johnsoniae UW101]OXG00348.1 transcriptional regulator [Flavobacterium johnsoniae UW101]WQG83120.1 helix-turn-helix transcriptional regulator [Flavobacterium johnsoniae UW101]SHL90951.1 DNA-binding transcriptional regulator, XRE-family HTH domain [Flavobacterium johnsoniae]